MTEMPKKEERERRKMKKKSNMKRTVSTLAVSVLVILSFFQAIYAPPVVPIGASTQANPFESNPTGGINNTLVGAVGTEAAARDGSFDTGVTWQIGGTTNSYLNMTPFNASPPTLFTIGWVDIKIRYQASATVDDRYRFMYQVGSRQRVLQTYVSGAAAKFDNDGAADERAFSRVVEPFALSPSGWNWTGIANLKVRIETQQQGAGEDSTSNTITVYEVWLSIYSSAYPYSPTIPLTARPSYVKYWDKDGGNSWTADEPAINDTDGNNIYNSGVDTILTFNMNASQLPNIPNDGATIKVPAGNIRYYDKNGDGKWTGGGLEGEPAIYDATNPGVWDIGSIQFGQNDDVRVGTQPPGGVAIEPPVVLGLHAGDTFFIDVYVVNVFKMHGFQFVIRYDTTYLTALPGFFSYNPFMSPAPSGINDTEGWVAVTFSSYMGDGVGFTGSGPVVRIYFSVDNDGTSLLDIDTSPLSPTSVSNVFGEEIPMSYWRDGVYTVLTHNVAVTDVTFNATQVMPGETLKVDATVANWGAQDETFTVTAYYSSTPIGSPQTVTNLAPGTTEIVTFDWDTSGVPVSHYVVKAETTLASDEYPSDNVKEGGTVIVGRHDVAVADVVRAYPTIDVGIPESEVLEVQSGRVVYINVTVNNVGTFAETFNVTASYSGGGNEGPRDIYGDYILETRSGVSLDAGVSQTLTFAWSTFTVEHYWTDWATCSAKGRVTEVPYEKGVDYDNTGNNVYMDGSVNVTAPTPPPAQYTRIYLPNQWIADGSAMGWHADDASWAYTLPFDFPFYGAYYRTVYISSNGLITFAGYDSSYFNSIPGLASKLAVGVAWDDWVTPEPYDVYIWQPDSHHVIVRWYVRWIGSSTVANFEAVLGIDGTIQFNYGYSDGFISATVGISNGFDNIIAEDLTNLNYINSILFTPYRPEHDLRAYLEAPPNLMLGQSAILNATVNNFGTRDEANVQLQLLINDIMVDSITVPELFAGSSYELSYTWAPSAEGSYNVTAFAPPVLGETFTLDNIANTTIYVITIEHFFREDFSTTTLDPHWQIWTYGFRAPSPPEATYQQETRYSLTEGHLRYYLGSMTSEWASEPLWAGPSSPYWYYPSMHLYRMFEGTDWILDTKVAYSAPYANAAQQAFCVFFGNPQQRQEYRNNAIIVESSVWDAWHQVYIKENGVIRSVTSLPINRYWDTLYYRIIRTGHQFTFQWSRDGIAYNTALTETMGSQIDGLPQGVDITGQAFWSDTYSYSQYDYVYLTPPPEHELAVSLETPDNAVLGGSVLLNATVSNQGLNDEANVGLQLIIEGSLVDSVVIPELSAGSWYRLSYLWTPTAEGNYNITAYATPVPDEADTTNNQATRFVAVFRPLIQPREGEWANYSVTVPYQQLLLSSTYSYYLSPTQMYVSLMFRDQYGNTWTSWLILNIINRQVEAGMWAGYWYPLWIEKDVSIGSRVNILGTAGTVTSSRFIEVGDFLVECWELQFEWYGYNYTFWFDKANGLVVAVDGIGYYTETWRLTATNVPLNYLPRIRIQTNVQSGPVGTDVTVTGINATPNGSVEIYWDNTLAGTRTADQNGNFVFTFTIPPSTRGPHNISALDLTTNVSDTTVFTVSSSISVTPPSGPMGTKVQVNGAGFGAYESVDVSFEDMRIGEAYADGDGSFTATFNIPVSQSGTHLVKAWYGTNYVQTTFTVTDVEPLDVNIDVGTVFFKGETVEFYVQTVFKGKPVDITLMKAVLYKSDGTNQTLTYQQMTTGLYRIRYTITSKGAMTGTYTLVVEARLTTNAVAAYGTSIKTFIVKPTWEREATRTTAMSITSIALVSAMILLYRKEKKKLL